MNEPSKENVKWFYRPVWVIVAILTAGPFALPLVWLSPKLDKWLKIFLTIAVLLITLWMVQAMVNIYHLLIKQMADLQGLSQ